MSACRVLIAPTISFILAGILHTEAVGFATVKAGEERGNDDLMEWNNVASLFCYRQETIRPMNGRLIWYGTGSYSRAFLW